MAKSKSELAAAIVQAQTRFYAWEPPGNPFQCFRCWHIQPYSRMTEEQCKARATKPELFKEAGCSNGCPRWRHYHKEFKKNFDDGLVRRAYR